MDVGHGLLRDVQKHNSQLGDIAGGEVEPCSFHLLSHSAEMFWVIVKMDGHVDMLSKGFGCSL